MLDHGVTFIPKALNFVTDPIRTAAPTGWSFRHRPVAVGELHRRRDGAVAAVDEELTNEESELLIQLLASVAARVQGRG